MHNTAETYLAGRDTALAMLIEQFGPCTLTPRHDYFLVLCDSIISQQLSVKASETIFRRVCEAAQGTLTPERLTSLSLDQLRRAGCSVKKAEYLHSLAHAFMRNHIVPEHFPYQSDEEIIKQLVKVKGVGVWTAQMFLMFALGRLDVFAPDDNGIQRAMNALGMISYTDKAATKVKRAMTQYAERWQPYRTIACWYLWRSLENTPL